ncbi:MAG: hypothetical protein PHH14_07865, partial [Candidatus Margulisbacteria bacterium]|nr:hypothetical protein [Candidatus Margulisiibacteriota bacterium]
TTLNIDNTWTYTLPATKVDSVTYTIKAKATDNVGNIQAAPTTASFTWDTQPPTGVITIEGGAASTPTLAVTITVAATDPAGVIEMSFQNRYASAEAWEPYATSKLWTLRDTGTNPRRVYVRFKDNAGNFTPASDYSMYDDINYLPGASAFMVSKTTLSAVSPPTITEITANGIKLADGVVIAKNPEIKVAIETADPSSLAADYLVQFKIDEAPVQVSSLAKSAVATSMAKDVAAFETTAAPKNLAEGKHTLTVSVTDAAGHEVTKSFFGLTVSSVLLSQIRGNYPNPFAPAKRSETTRIAYDLTEDTDIEINIYDISGRAIRKLSAVAGYKSGSIGAGGAIGYNEVVWDGKDETGNLVANGTYLYIILKKGNSTPLGRSQMAVIN